jgi:hypothetical protein
MTLAEQVIELTNQVNLIKDQIRNLSNYRFFIPLFTSTISGFIALIALVNSFANGRSANLARIKQNIDGVKADLEEMPLKMRPLEQKERAATITTAEKIELESLQEAKSAKLERLFNNYEDGCESFYSAKWYNSKLSKSEFITKYKADIRDWIVAYEAKFTGPVTRYTKMIQFYEEHCK